jgi:uncharacterized protein (TIGR01777 family)
MNVLLSGATGFVGGHLRRHLEGAGHRVTTIGRSHADFDWTEPSVRSAVSGCEALVHLAGENLFARRWSARQKEVLGASRIETTRRLATELARAGRGTFVGASAIGYYGPRGTEEVDESAPAGAGFLARLCRDWEQAAEPARSAGLRVAHVRIGLALGAGGGALARMLPLFRLGLGGPLGNGAQIHSWIHVDDLCALFRFVLEHPTCHGAYNGTAPAPVAQREFARILGAVLGRPAFLPAPAFALRLALGEVAGVLLDGVRAVPRRAREAGFAFAHPELRAALQDLLTSSGRSAR